MNYFRNIAFGFVLAGLGLSVGGAYAAVPPCEECDDAFVVEEVGENNVTITGPPYIYDVYDDCVYTTCCGSYPCSLSTVAEVIEYGWWNSDLGTLGMTLPTDWAAGSSGLTYQGDSDVSVPAHTVSGCVLGKCQNVNQEFGSIYQTTVRNFNAKKICYVCSPSDVNCVTRTACEEIPFTGQESYTMLLDEAGILPTTGCGLPTSGGCTGVTPNPCANPSQNTCP
jgi:hypothetical protein